MKTEKQVEARFLFYKKQLINRFGNKGLYQDQIEKIGSVLFGNLWRGCFLQNENIGDKPGMFIINTDVLGGPGIHWLSMFLTKTTAYLYDSFGRDSEKLVKHLTKKLKGKKMKIINSDTDDAEQYGEKSEICGQLSLAFLCVVKEMGIRNAIKI